MANSYDDMQGSPMDVQDHPARENMRDENHYAGDVVPLPINPLQGSDKPAYQPNSIYAKDSDKVTSYSTFVAKKLPYANK